MANILLVKLDNHRLKPLNKGLLFLAFLSFSFDSLNLSGKQLLILIDQCKNSRNIRVAPKYFLYFVLNGVELIYSVNDFFLFKLSLFVFVYSKITYEVDMV